LTIAALVVGILMIGAFAFRARAQQMTEAVRATAMTWLLNNCALGEEDRLERAVRDNAAVIEPFFLEVLAKGPDPKLVAEVEATANERYSQREAMLKGDAAKAAGLTDEQRRLLTETTRAEFVDLEKRNFVLRFQAQAVAGLGLTGGPEGKKALERLAKDEASPFHQTATLAMEKLPRAK
jgi:hypothetical protein